MGEAAITVVNMLSGQPVLNNFYDNQSQERLAGFVLVPE